MIDKGEYSIKQIKSYVRYALFYKDSENGNKSIATRYANKQVNPKYYGKIALGAGVPKPKILTREEYQKGEPGLVYMDTRTGRLTFYE